MSSETDTYPLDGVLCEPEGGAILIMHGNSSNFYTGVPRALPPLRPCDTRIGAARGQRILHFSRHRHNM